jgi:phenylalanyl-tRNA synthetase alpha chain
MALIDFTQQLEALLQDARNDLEAIQSSEQLEAARVKFVGAKNGRLKSLQKSMGEVAPEEKPAAGKKFNEVREALQSLLESAQSRIGAAGSADQALTSGANASVAKRGAIVEDATLPGIAPSIGRLHPITQTIEHLKEIMGRLGFSAIEGPEIEDTWHNFVALNIPEDHPARDPLDNFYLSVAKNSNKDPNALDAKLLRSQTSTVQIRAMESTKPPLRIISLGRVYRPDEADATHFPMFHQMEGLWVDTHVTMAQLKSVLRMFATSYLGGDVTIRFRPSFFPFTEPSVEVDYLWNDNWVEFGGAGMVDPNVLKAVGYNPEEVSGFAFGLGVERLCMRRYRITDIRDLFRNDVRFLKQF